VKERTEAKQRDHDQQLQERPAETQTAEAERQCKIETWAGRQALGQMTGADMAKLTLEDTDDIAALFAWEPSKISELDPRKLEDDLTATATWRDHTDRGWSNVSSQGFERNIRMREGRRGLQPLP
jgi:hypothetical protein